MRRALVAAAVLLATAGTAHAQTFASQYRFGASAGFGAALAPPTTQMGMTTSLTYYEYSGWLGKLIVLIGAAPQKPRPTTRVVSSKTECYSTWCTTYTNYETTYPSQADWDRYQEELKEYEKLAVGILTDGQPLDLYLDIALQSLGGDTSGASLVMMYRAQWTGMFGLPVFRINFGFGVGKYTFHGRTRSVVVQDGDTLSRMEVTEDSSYGYAGMPLRFTGFVHPRLAGYLQFDFNMFALPVTDDPEPSPIRGGVEIYLNPLFVRGEIVSTALRPGSMTAFAEVQVVY